MLRTGRSQYIYITFFLLTIVLSMALLFVSALLPQSMIVSNIGRSIGGLTSEGLRPDTFDRQAASSLDIYSDVEMLRATATMNKDNLGSILTNDLYSYDTADSNIEDLGLCVSGVEPDNVINYVRYWMGFRVLLRFLLVFLDYFQIKRYLALLFFSLFLYLVFDIAKNTDKKLAFIFALSIFFVRIHVIVNTLQYSWIFFITFLSMLLVPWIHKNPKWDKLFFMELGMFTMFFDFYTVPLVSCGFPLVYYITLQWIDRKEITLKKILQLLAVWFCGWVFMWLAKLALTSIFTDVNGFNNGFYAFFYRVGIVKDDDLQFYNVIFAFTELFKVIFSDFKGAVIYLLTAICIAVTVFVQAIKRHIPVQVFSRYKGYLVIAAVPVIWFVVTAQPISIHAFFQYRSVALIYWSLGAYLYMIFQHNSPPQSFKTRQE